MKGVLIIDVGGTTLEVSTHDGDPGERAAAEDVSCRRHVRSRATCYREPAVSFAMASLRLNEPGLARCGKSLKL